MVPTSPDNRGSTVQVIPRNSDWFIAPPAPVLIGRSNCFGYGFSTVI